ncbi:Nucleolar protein 16 [Caenorhabditis elegans]|uniref:Nucleolar protein 16 n=1 Tax=Caenorhabditis elegans TaxID=6239 RepID=A0A4V0INJ4_CAEEL|nr:Nucleolar protein 16 [Caenorhabditis elegans]VTW47590.1 Nucleolar protein 16 [Caenorhabditis elegans]
MRSPKSVRRPHIRQQLTNRRKNLGRVAKSQRNQFRQWLLTAVLPNSINDQRKEAFASLELTEQPQQVEKVKKSEKKKAQKQIAKDHEAEQKVNAKKAAEKEARRAEAEAKKRAAQEEEHKQWKAEQERIQKEQEKKEADLKKLQAEKKKEKAVKAEKAEKAEKTKKASTPAPVEEEIVVKKVANDRSAAPAPEPKTPTNTPAEPAEQVQEITGKKNKKNKKKSESEATAAPASVEQVVEQPKVVTEEPHQQAAPQEKKNKKNKRKSESENVPAASETPVEPVVESTTPPATENKKKNKKDKKKSESEKVTEQPVESAPAPPQVEQVVETTPPASENKKKNKKDKKKSESEKAVEEPVQAAPSSKKPTADDSMDFLDFVTAKPDRSEVAAPVEVAKVDESTAVTSENRKKNKKDKKKSESEKAVEEPVQAAPTSKKPTADDSMDFLDFVTAKEERVEEVAPVQEQVKEQKKVEKPVAPVSKKPTADDNMDFLDFVTAKPEKTESVEEHIEAPMIVEPVHAENEVDSDVALDSFEIIDAQEVAELVSAPEMTVEETAAAAGGKKKNKKNKNKKNSESESTPAAEPVKEVTPEIVEEVFEKKTITPSTAAAAAPAPGSKKNKKNKKNSESESAPAAEPVKEVTPEIVEEVFEKKTVTPSTEAAAAPASASKKNKKNKKGSGISESHDTAPAPTVEIPQTTEGGKGSPGSDKENSGSAVNGSAKKQMSVEELDYGVPGQTTDTTTDKKNKKKNKKGKNSNSISENAQVIAHLEQDHLDQMADDEVQAITGAAGSHSPPIQVHEVTSSEQHSNGVEKNTTIEITQAVDGTDMSQTQFQKNVEKLVQATLAKHDIVEIDPTVKLRIDAQLIKLSEKKAPAVVMEHVNYIKPLPMELHVSRPSTPSRDRVYKLLPKDIIFCAGLMDSHGENYAAMAADERNIFKDTSRALQRKIRIFKESPHYHTYLRAKEENRPIEEVIAEAQH